MKISSTRKSIFALIAVTMLAFSIVGTTYASSGAASIDIQYSNISIVIDGAKLTPKDSNGNLVEPFSYNGTIYLPARALGEALGKTVSWNGDTATATIGTPVSNSVVLSTGFYTVGTDIAVGKYNCTSVSGKGNFVVYSASGDLLVNELFGVGGGYYVSSFNNLTLKVGATIEITSGLSIQFTKI
jgi:hypothetical protein